MPAARAMTGNMSLAASIADKALEAAEGITIPYRVSKYGSLDACDQQARSLQSSFTSLRARVRRLANRVREDELMLRDQSIVGKYDALACLRQLMPGNEGWQVWIGPAISALADLEIIDNATGKNLAGVDPLLELIQRAQDPKRAGTVTALEWDWALTQREWNVWEIDGRCWFPRPGSGGNENAEIDEEALLNAWMDENEGD